MRKSGAGAARFRLGRRSQRCFCRLSVVHVLVSNELMPFTSAESGSGSGSGSGSSSRTKGDVSPAGALASEAQPSGGGSPLGERHCGEHFAHVIGVVTREACLNFVHRFVPPFGTSSELVRIGRRAQGERGGDATVEVAEN